MRELALFAGGGGGILAGQLLGWKTVCAVERDAYAAQVLAQRQNDRSLEAFPIWSDVCSFDGKPWRGIVEVISGGFPCQDISVAGKGEGITGAKSGMWKEMARIIREVRPRIVFVENSPAITSRGLDTVLGDLAAIGYNAAWGVLSARDLGAWHIRERMWIVAHINSDSVREQSKSTGGCCQRKPRDSGENASNADCSRELQQKRNEQELRRRASYSNTTDADSLRARLSIPREEQDGEDRKQKRRLSAAGGWWKVEPDVVRVVHGLPRRLDRIKVLGNAQVPIVAASAFTQLYNKLIGLDLPPNED